MHLVPTTNGFKIVADSTFDEEQLSMFLYRVGRKYLLLQGENKGAKVQEVDFRQEK